MSKVNYLFFDWRNKILFRTKTYSIRTNMGENCPNGCFFLPKDFFWMMNDRRISKQKRAIRWGSENVERLAREGFERSACRRKPDDGLFSFLIGKRCGIALVCFSLDAEMKIGTPKFGNIFSLMFVYCSKNYVYCSKSYVYCCMRWI